MKKIVGISILLLTFFVPVFAQYVPNIPTFMPTRYTSIGGYHVTDTADYFTIFANPGAIDATDAEALKSALDMRFINPELALSIGELAYSALTEADMTDKLADFQADVLRSLGTNGVNAGFEILGPLAVGSISHFDGGAFGWGLISKMHFTAFIPTVTEMDAHIDFDNMLQFTYAAPIIDSGANYLAAGLSLKGLFIVETGLVGINPFELLADVTSLSSGLPIYAHYGYSLDAGIYYQYLNVFTAGLVWRDFFNKIWTDVYGIDTIASAVANGNFPSSTSNSSGSAQSSLDIGVGVDVPMFFLEDVITNFAVMLDYEDIISVLHPETITRNPLLNLSLGAEITFFDFVSLRGGISDLYLNAGAGVRLGDSTIDFSLYGQELGLEPGSIPQLNASLSFMKHF